MVESDYGNSTVAISEIFYLGAIVSVTKANVTQMIYVNNKNIFFTKKFALKFL